MFVKQFAEIIKDIAADIDCDGGTKTGSHKVPSSITIYDENGDSYELTDIFTDRLSCGCAVGIELNIKKNID